jgi:hypothetical protein
MCIYSRELGLCTWSFVKKIPRDELRQVFMQLDEQGPGGAGCVLLFQ